MSSNGRYGLSRYGETIYGSAVPDGLRWGIQIDWTNSGVWGSANEALYCRGLETERGRDVPVRIDSGDSKANGLQPVIIGNCTLIMDNSTRRFDPRNTSSPLYPNVGLNKNVRIFVADDDGIWHHVFAGKIRDIREINDREMAFYIEDALRDLNSVDSAIDLRQSVSVRDAINAGLDQYGSSATRDIGNAAGFVPYFYATGQTFASVLAKLAEMELGMFYIAADGKPSFYGRYSEPKATVDVDQTMLSKNVRLQLPWDVLRDKVTVRYYTPKIYGRTETGAYTDLWVLPETMPLAAGERKSFIAPLEFGQNFITATNVGIYNLDAYDSPGSTTTSVSANITRSLTLLGNAAVVDLQNIGAVPAYITSMRITGDALYASDASKKFDGAGKLELVLDNEYIQSDSIAQTLASQLYDRLSASGTVYPQIEMEARPDVQFMDLCDLVQLDIPARNLSGLYMVGKVTHSWDRNAKNGKSVLTRLHLEPYTPIPDGIFRLGSGLLNTNVLG